MNVWAVILVTKTEGFCLRVAKMGRWVLSGEKNRLKTEDLKVQRDFTDEPTAYWRYHSGSRRQAGLWELCGDLGCLPVSVPDWREEWDHKMNSVHCQTGVWRTAPHRIILIHIMIISMNNVLILQYKTSKSQNITVECANFLFFVVDFVALIIF